MLIAHLHLTLCDPMDCSPPGSSVHGILQITVLEWVAIPFSRWSSQPRDQTQVSHIANRFFTIWATSLLNIAFELPIPTQNKICHLSLPKCAVPIVSSLGHLFNPPSLPISGFHVSLGFPNLSLHLITEHRKLFSSLSQE